MTVDALAAWLLSVMMSAVPPGKTRFPDSARETAVQGEARYRAIARTIAEVSLDPEEQPLYEGPRAREKTAAMLLAISYHESHWRKDVDLGIGPHSRGGGGRYHCMMQIGVPKGRTPEGWTGEQLVQSRERCFRRGLHILQRGKRQCRSGYGFLHHYATGSCRRGRRAVTIRLNTLTHWLRKYPFEQARVDSARR